MTLEATPTADPIEGIDQHHYAGMATLRHVLRRFLAFSDDTVRTRGITTQEYQAMLVIAAHPVGEILAPDLAAEMMLEPAVAAQMAERMTAADLVETRRAPARDGVLLALTPHGEATLAALAAAHLRELMNHEPLMTSSLRMLRRATS